MIKYDNKEFRNLVEQVQYLTDYHDVNQGLVQWGIRVVGQVATASELPDPATYEGEYGDAIAVGTEAPFFFYIWTRASIEGSPAYWFPFGEISTVGPQGPEGPAGPQGEQGKSSRWYTGYGHPGNLEKEPGDLYLDASNGTVYQYSEVNKWSTIINIKGAQGAQGPQGPQGLQGPQGPQGPKGNTGDTGGLVNINGILSNADQLPTPASLNNTTIAYLVGAAEPYDLYIQVGTDPATALWNNIGPLNVSTLVFANGIAQNSWNADTKVDKMVGTPDAGATRGFLYGLTYDGTTPNLYKIQVQSNGETIPIRNSSGNFYVSTPSLAYECTNKKYVDDNFVAKNSSVASNNSPLVYTNDTVRDHYLGAIEDDYKAYNIPMIYGATAGKREMAGWLLTGTPVNDYHAANKKYVDDNFVPAPSFTGILYYNSTLKQITTYPTYQSAPAQGQIPIAKQGGRISVNTPTEDIDATNKQYVDTNFVSKSNIYLDNNGYLHIDTQ